MLLLTLHHTSCFLSFNSTQYKKQKHIEKSIFLFWNIYLITFPFFDDNNMKNKLSSLSFFCHLPPKCCIYADCVFFGVTLISSFICVGSVDLFLHRMGLSPVVCPVWQHHSVHDTFQWRSPALWSTSTQKRLCVGCLSRSSRAAV